MRYLKELSNWESETAQELKKEAALLRIRKSRMDSIRKAREADLAQVRTRKKQLEEDRLEAKHLVEKLKSQSRRLEEVLAEQQARARRLDDELNRIIEEEARKAAEEERRRRQAAEEARLKKAREDSIAAAKERKKDKKTQKTQKPQKPQTAPAPVQPAPAQDTPPKPAKEPVSGDFVSAKGRLPMPVSGPAVIVSDFGRHTHRQLSKVEVQNNGIDIETTAGASAVAVYPGVVSMVIVMDGYNNVVLVRHGEYLTVYAGISDLNVHKGQTVSQGQALGRIYSDPADGNRTRLHFEVRHEKDKLNPAEWLR